MLYVGFGVVLSVKDWVLNIKQWLILGTLITLSVAVASAIITLPDVAIELDTSAAIYTVEAHEEKSITTYTKSAPQSQALASTEEIVRAYFSDIPIMVEVARCESGFNHLNPATGEVFLGHYNTNDVGVMQINQYYHAEKAAWMGYDIYDLEDNLAYARYLYEHEGTRPWNASRNCWQNSLIAMR